MVNMNLRVARVKRKMSQYGLSLETGISQSRISLFENGFRCPTTEQAEKIAEVLQVRLKKIFPVLLKRGIKKDNK